MIPRSPAGLCAFLLLCAPLVSPAGKAERAASGDRTSAATTEAAATLPARVSQDAHTAATLASSARTDSVDVAIAGMEEEVERRCVALQALCALAWDTPGDPASTPPGPALASRLEQELWGLDTARHPDLALAREALAERLRELDQAEIAIRLALDAGFPALAERLFTERFDPACLEILVLCDAARRAAAMPAQ